MINPDVFKPQPSPSDMARLVEQFAYLLLSASTRDNEMMLRLHFAKDSEQPLNESYSRGDTAYLLFTGAPSKKVLGLVNDINKNFDLQQPLTISTQNDQFIVDLTPLMQEPKKFQKALATIGRRGALKTMGKGCATMLGGVATMADGAGRVVDRPAGQQGDYSFLPLVPSDTPYIVKKGVASLEMLGGGGLAFEGFMGHIIDAESQLTDSSEHIRIVLPKTFRENVQQQLRQMRKIDHGGAELN